MTKFELGNCQACPIHTSLRRESRTYDRQEDKLIIELANDGIGEFAEFAARELDGSDFHAALSDEAGDTTQSIAKYLRRMGDEALGEVHAKKTAVIARLGEISLDCPGPLGLRAIDDANDTAYVVGICRSPALRENSRLQCEAAFVRRIQIE